MSITTLDTPASELGEGIFLDEKSMILYWVDINNSKLFQYDLNIDELITTYQLAMNPSCILSVVEGLLTYIDSEGIKQLCTATGKLSLVIRHLAHDARGFRANDGVKLPNGNLVFGTMSFHPEQTVGKIYTLNSHDNDMKVHQLGIHIPNTFIPSEDCVYLSDSLLQRTYILNLKDLNCLTCDNLILWKDFSDYHFTPDGGCISERGYLHIALWDGAAIGVFDKDGNVMHEIVLPVLKPTNCTLLDNRWLYVTSAREGMTESQLHKYPLSGRTLLVDLGVDYVY
ncbi:SMP-30/gluconolactonase/LRE family protein [Shewanella algae]|uniref:SMP-30/gluconolactonase/LRE family protein n=1 Tax=Shewanella algae TaxID=38313 RepID=UPI001AACC201|nr:SMP-30/gluconolactonase/LRE family protein [Shewanella algae]QTE85286.1 SMP-30/gluconolactonase/LRE family protein [Shewanella algae]